MSEDYDRFNDVIQANNGIFAEGSGAVEDGLASFDRPQVHVEQPGVIVEMQCRGCGKPRRLTFEWPEIVALRFDVSPQVAYRSVPQLQQYAQVPWVRSHQGWWPSMSCMRCRGNFNDPTKSMLRPIFTPEECTRHVQKALQNGWLHPQAEQQLTQVVMQQSRQQPGMQQQY